MLVHENSTSNFEMTSFFWMTRDEWWTISFEQGTHNPTDLYPPPPFFFVNDNVTRLQIMHNFTCTVTQPNSFTHMCDDMLHSPGHKKKRHSVNSLVHTAQWTRMRLITSKRDDNPYWRHERNCITPNTHGACIFKMTRNSSTNSESILSLNAMFQEYNKSASATHNQQAQQWFLQCCYTNCEHTFVI